MINFEKAAQALRVKQTETQAANEPANFTAALEAAQHQALLESICAAWEIGNEIESPWLWKETKDRLIGNWEVMVYYYSAEDLTDEIDFLADIALQRSLMRKAKHA